MEERLKELKSEIIQYLEEVNTSEAVIRDENGVILAGTNKYDIKDFLYSFNYDRMLYGVIDKEMIFTSGKNNYGKFHSNDLNFHILPWTNDNAREIIRKYNANGRVTNGLIFREHRYKCNFMTLGEFDGKALVSDRTDEIGTEVLCDVPSLNEIFKNESLINFDYGSIFSVIKNIDDNQLKVMEQFGEGMFVYTGDAGTGKTSIALMRLRYLINEEKLDISTLAFLIYNESMIPMCEEFLNSIELKGKIKLHYFSEFLNDKVCKTLNIPFINGSDSLESDRMKSDKNALQLIEKFVQKKVQDTYENLLRSNEYRELINLSNKVDDKATTMIEEKIKDYEIFSALDVIDKKIKEKHDEKYSKMKDFVKRLESNVITWKKFKDDEITISGMKEKINRISSDVIAILLKAEETGVKKPLDNISKLAEKVLKIHKDELSGKEIKDEKKKEELKLFRGIFKLEKDIANLYNYCLHPYSANKELYELVEIISFPFKDLLSKNLELYSEFSENNDFDFSENNITANDVVLIAYMRLKMDACLNVETKLNLNKMSVEHLTIDEAQDFSHNDLIVINELMKKSSTGKSNLTITGDLNQKINDNHYLPKFPFDESANFNLIYRNQAGIVNFVKSLIKKNYVITEAELKPKLYITNNLTQCINKVCVEIKENKSSKIDSLIKKLKSSNVYLSGQMEALEKQKEILSICILSSDISSLKNAYNQCVFKDKKLISDRKDLKDLIDSKNIIFSPVEYIKGYEFDHVIVLSPEKLLSKKALYVSSSRAKDTLKFFSTDKNYNFGGMDRRLYEIVNC